MIREANLSDFGAIAALESQVLKTHYEAHPDIFVQSLFNGDSVKHRKYFKELLADEEKSRGIGGQLVSKAKEYAKEIGAARLELFVWEFNKNAIKFYEHLGMSAISRRMAISLN